MLYSFPEPISKKDKILLVEDRLQTGKTMIKGRELLLARGAIIKTACFFIQHNCLIKPDYYLDINIEEIIFPWE
jgi:adenine/guanine phosphoribosyltransferase-like PRPP-binding protein